MPTSDHLHHLPESVRPLLDIIGADAVLALIDRLGGRTVGIPMHAETLGPDHDLVLAVGLDAAVQIVRLMAGEKIAIPRAVAFHRAVRDHRILLALDRGATVGQVATQNGLTDRAVAIIKRRHGRSRYTG